MSFRRKTDDGNVPGRGFGSAERGSAFVNKGKNVKHAAAKRSARYARDLEPDESLITEESEKDRYLITYADLITLLLGFFIILYSISNVDLAKYQSMVFAMGDVFGGEKGEFVGMDEAGGGGAPSPLDVLKQDVNNLIEEYQYGNSVNIEENSRGITIRILEDILFPSGSAELTTSSKFVLHRLGTIFKKLPNDIRVEGHTDNVPINTAQYQSNWHLSVNRALNTAYYLIKNEQLPPDRVSIVGFSEYMPVAENKTNSGRSANRRVDIVIVKE